MNIRTVLAWAAAIALTAALAMTYTAGYAQKQRVASIANVKGTVSVKQSGQKDWAPAAVRMELKEGDELKTDAGSTAIIRMDDGTMVKVGPLATMKMDKLDKTGAASKTNIDMGSGKTWSRVNKLNEQSDFSIKTPTAVAGVRGTFFSSEVAQTSDSTFDVFEGAVAVSSLTNPDQAVMVGASQRSTVAPNQDPSAPSAIPANEYDAGRSGFSEEEFAAATYDLQISVSPQVVEPGKNATVNVQLFRNNSPFRGEVNVKLNLSGSATFVSNGSPEISATTDSNGALSLEITSTSTETVTVSAQLTIKVKK
ncbi:MAG TPA: FecR domain-containing protein [bacterium]|nr:FecR domain-containing protein [bacterium]